VLWPAGIKIILPISSPLKYLKRFRYFSTHDRTVPVMHLYLFDMDSQVTSSGFTGIPGCISCQYTQWSFSLVYTRSEEENSWCIYSPPFYTGRNGYKMCIRAYLNGDGTGEGTHLFIFFVLMKGEYDPLLEWPFDRKLSLILADQDRKEHLVQTFKSNIQSHSYQRPKSGMNHASGCTEFAKLSVLDNPSCQRWCHVH